MQILDLSFHSYLVLSVPMKQSWNGPYMVTFVEDSQVCAFAYSTFQLWGWQFEGT